MKVERLRKENYEELLDFINMVFSQDLIRVHFAEDLSYLFAEDDEHMRNQFALRDETGRIRCAIGSIPYTYVVGDERFNVRTVTNVATHYRHTGKGYMRTVMNAVIEEMVKEDVDFAILSGHRERYRFFGFEAAGVCQSANYIAHNAANRKKLGEIADFTFREVNQEDTETIRRCTELYNREVQRIERPEDQFIAYGAIWRGKVFAVLDSKGKFCGYLNYCDRWGGDMRELYLYNPSLTPRVIASFMNFTGRESVTLTYSPFDKENVRVIQDTAETLHTSQTCRMKLFKPERLTAACLNAKLKAGVYMPEGEIIIGCVFGNLRTKNNGVFTAELTGEAPAFTASGYEIYSLLFGPCSQSIPVWSKELAELSPWFPAPFHINPTDRY